MKIHVVEKVLKVNDELAALNRCRLAEAGVAAVNIMSAPGSGKTSLIEAVIPLLREEVRLGVLEGDPDTTLDAERIAKLDVPVVQIMTAGGCHLEANLVGRGLGDLSLDTLDLVFIENVGNLVCPVEFDLGEGARVTVLSVTEGHDKPAKYPKAFRKTDLVVLNKVDLLPYVPFDEQQFLRYLSELRHEPRVLRTSCATGEGIEEWAAWLSAQVLATAKT